MFNVATFLLRAMFRGIKIAACVVLVGVAAFVLYVLVSVLGG